MKLGGCTNLFTLFLEFRIQNREVCRAYLVSEAIINVHIIKLLPSAYLRQLAHQTHLV